MKKFILMLILAVFTLQMIGCATHIHTVGKGPQGNEKTEKWQWYALWGLVPVSEIDTREMAKTDNYEIKTEYKFLNILANVFTQYVSFVSRSVEVKE